MSKHRRRRHARRRRSDALIWVPVYNTFYRVTYDDGTVIDHSWNEIGEPVSERELPRSAQMILDRIK